MGSLGEEALVGKMKQAAGRIGEGGEYVWMHCLLRLPYPAHGFALSALSSGPGGSLGGAHSAGGPRDLLSTLGLLLDV
jgi:hypothetical protein